MTILSEMAEGAAQKQAEWMDTVVFSNISGWKGDLLLRFPNRYLARILGIKVEVEHRRLDVGNFGNEITVTLNGRVIGKKKFI